MKVSGVSPAASQKNGWSNRKKNFDLAAFPKKQTIDE